MTFQFFNNTWLEQKIIDFSKLVLEFRPGYQNEKSCFKNVVNKKIDSRVGIPLKHRIWSQNTARGEQSHYNSLNKELKKRCNGIHEEIKYLALNCHS
jgi:hypothetical protein